MAAAPRPPVRLRVAISPEVWHEEVGRFAAVSTAGVAAKRERARLEHDGVAVRDLLACDADGSDGTQLAGLVKVYVPINHQPPSGRPFGFVFSPERDDDGPYLELIAYGERHPKHGTRSVYHRAHKRLHGRYPDQ